MISQKKGSGPVGLVGVAFVVVLVLGGCSGLEGEDIRRPIPTTSVPGGENTSRPTNADQEPQDKSTPESIRPEPGVSQVIPTNSVEPVPPPISGNVSDTVAPLEVPEPIKTSLLAKATPSEGVTVALRRIEAVESTAKGPGQVAGPALAMTVAVKNAGVKTIDLSGVEISLTDSSGNPGAGMIGEPADWFQGSIAPGAEASGVYVFTIDKPERDQVSLSVTVRPGMAAVVFEGSP